MSESLVFLSKSLIHSFFRKNERFAQKTVEQIPSPAKKDLQTKRGKRMVKSQSLMHKADFQTRSSKNKVLRGV